MKKKSLKNPNAVALGHRGGLATSKIPGHLKRASKLAVKARWPKKIKN